MVIANPIWQNLTHYIDHPPFQKTPGDSCFVDLAKTAGNLSYQTLIILVMGISLLVIPILMVLDFCVTKKTEDRKWTAMKVPTLLEFYSGKRNDRGVTLEEIWQWDDKRLETQHDYIQWLFPIETVGMNPTAPPTNTEIIKSFQNNNHLQKKMRRSFEMMLQFYGFHRDQEGVISMGPDFVEKARGWLNPGNHNYRRISRILHSLILHGLEKDAQSFFEVLKEVYRNYPDQISPSAFSHWENALKK